MIFLALAAASIALAGAQLASEPPEAMALARLAYDLARSGKFDEAVAGLEQASRLAPANPLYRSALGGLFERQGKIAEAAGAFAGAVKLDPNNSVFRLRLAALQSKTGQYEPARANLVEVLKLKPGDADAASLLESVSLEWGAELARAQRFRGGLVVARDTATRFPGSAPAHLMLGLFESRNQQNMKAVAAYRRALEIDPQSAEASAGLGIAQSSAGLSKEAQATFEAGVKKFPADAMHRQAYGVLLAKLAESGSASAARASEMLESALKLDPSLAEAHYQLGNLALSAGDAAKAADHFAAAARNGLDDSRLHYATARALRRLGRQTEADQQLALFTARKSAEDAGSGKP